MSSNLQQLQLTYDQVQDRLVLIFFTQDFSEYRFWLTRRVAYRVYQMLKKMVGDMIQDQNALQQAQQKAESQVKKEKQHPEATKFSTPITRCPLGETPLLLFKIQAQKTVHGTVQFHLEDMEGRSIEFLADLGLLNILSELIRKAILQTDWALDLDS